MYTVRARMRSGSVHSAVPCSREETSFTSRSLARDAGGASEDGVLEGLWVVAALGTSCVGVLVEPGGVSSQVTLPCLHLMDFPCHKLPQGYERVREEAEGVLLVCGSGSIGGPVLEEQVPTTVS